MSRMSDLHLDICEAIEDVLCDELCLEKCQRTYEIASKIFETILNKESDLGLGGSL